MGQFLIDSHGPPFRLDSNNNQWSIRLFDKKDIPCILISVENHLMEDSYVKVNLQKAIIHLYFIKNSRNEFPFARIIPFKIFHLCFDILFLFQLVNTNFLICLCWTYFNTFFWSYETENLFLETFRKVIANDFLVSLGKTYLV